MVDTIVPPTSTDRATAYAELIPQVEALLQGETDAIAAMSNIAAALFQSFGHHWIGFYRVIGDELVLGPCQGPVACNRISFGKGVCGTAWKEQRTVIVPNVDLFPGHIACSALSRSEIVVPLRGRGGRIAAVLDIDSVDLKAFGPADAEGLERLVRAIEPLLA